MSRQVQFGLSACLLLMGPALWAEEPVRAVDIAPQDLATALDELAVQTDVQMLFDRSSLRGVQSPGLKGVYTRHQAVEKLVAPAGLSYTFTADNAVAIKKQVMADNGEAPTPARNQVPSTALPEMVVRASNTELSYSVPNAVTATKTNTPAIETPVAIQVVPSAVLQDQQAIKLDDAVKNISGVVSGFGFGTLEDTFIIRGFENSTNSWNLTEIYRDGALVIEGLFSLADVERVEIMKGPAAVLYGRAQPGGLVNVVTRRPQATAAYSLQQQFGSFDTYRTVLNAAGPIAGNTNFLYRVDFEKLNKDTFRDFTFNDQTYLSPKFVWRISGRTQLDFEYIHFNQDSIVDWGLPAIGNRVAGLPRERFLQEPDGRYANDFDGGGLTLTHSFSDNWNLQGKVFKYSETYSENKSVSPRSLDETTGILERGGTLGGAHVFDSIFGMVNLTGKFETWGIKHTMLLGADYFDSGFVEEGTSYRSSDGVPSINIFNPIYNLGVLNTPSPEKNFSYQIQDSWYGIYLQDQIQFFKDWHLLLGGRYDEANSTQSFSADRSDFTEDDDSEFSPRAGLLYRATPWLSLYTSYTEGYHHANIGRTTDGTDLQPERSHQYEVGAKADWWNGRLTSTLSLFHLTKSNITVSHPNPALALQGYVQQTGEARSQGVEFDVRGQLSDNWSLIATYAYMDARVTRDQGFDDNGTLTTRNQGNRLRNVPEHSGSVWLNHRFAEFQLPELSAGVGVFLASERQGDLENSYQLPGYARLDTALKYVHKMGPSRLTLQFNVNNLLDQYYIVSARSRLSNSPAESRSFLGSIRYDF